MSKEYHNQWTERGKESWDVDRLIRLAQSLPVQRVEISEIAEFDEVYWFDDEFRPTCRAVVEHARRIRDADLRYPVILSARGLVMDGMHRVAKAMLLGNEVLDAVRFDEDPEPDRILPKGSARPPNG